MTQTDYYVKRVLDAVFNGVPFTVGQTYVGLGVDDGSGGVSELTYSDYSRQPVVWNAALDDGSINTAQQVVWSPTSSWGTVTRAFLSDSSQGGNVLFIDGISVTAGAGSKIIIDPGDLYVT
jgi:hypothetical protein